jgi:hypothetical protein
MYKKHSPYRVSNPRPSGFCSISIYSMGFCSIRVEQICAIGLKMEAERQTEIRECIRLIFLLAVIFACTVDQHRCTGSDTHRS